MGFFKEFAKTLLVAEAQNQGFSDGAAGRPVAFVFSEAFSQQTDAAIAYHKGYANGQDSAIPRTLNGVNKVLKRE